MKKLILSLLPIFVVLILAGSSNLLSTDGNIESITSSKITIQSDSAKIPEKLQFTSEDSAFLHIDKHYDKIFVFNEHYYSKEIIAKNILPIYINSIISLYPSPIEYERLGAYEILYSMNDSSHSVNKLAKDSIVVNIGALSSFDIQQNIIDVNYDGYKDIVISFVSNTTDRNGLNFFFLFDSLKSLFIESNYLDSLFQEKEIYIDENERIISTGGRAGYNGFAGEDYKWNGSKYVLTTRYNVEWDEKSMQRLQIRKELINGKWEVVEIDTTL